MARHATWAALAVAVAVILGCGPAKELPNETSKGPSDNTPVSGVPAASEPEEKAFTAAIRAASLGSLTRMRPIPAAAR